MASARVSSSVEQLITDALKKLPASQTREKFMEDGSLVMLMNLKKVGVGLGDVGDPVAHRMFLG